MEALNQPLADAKGKTSIRGEALWDWQGEPPHRWLRRSVQMQEEVIDLILTWRDQHYGQPT